MGLRNIIGKAVVTAFRALDDVPVAGVLKHKSAVDYNPAAGVPNATSADTAIAGVLLEYFEAKLIDGKEILATDRKISFPTLYLNGATVAENDVIVLGADEWRVVCIMEGDPAGALTLLQVRK